MLSPNRKSIRHYPPKQLRNVLIQSLIYILIGSASLIWLIDGAIKYGGSVVDFLNPKYLSYQNGIRSTPGPMIIPLIIFGVGLYLLIITLLEIRGRKQESLLQKNIVSKHS